MKKAIIVGGSNGIGLSIVKCLIERRYFVYILDLVCPDLQILVDSNECKYIPCDLLNFDDMLFEKLNKDMDVNMLIITAGFGRVADFEHLKTTEIHDMIAVNTIAGIRIIRHFYNRIKSDELFYCGIMGSIAGLISSPMFSVYAASKAAICRFVESVNIELELSGTKNRILNVSPGSIKGTRFNGGDNNLELTHELANDIIEHIYKRDELFIPDYEEIYKDVLKRYSDNPHEFGISSYQYKKNSGRVRN